MCIFSGRIQDVSRTRLFARSARGSAQILVYGMDLNARSDVAMVMPLPVPPGVGPKGAKFLNLSGYPDLFDDMEVLFPSAAGRSSRIAGINVRATLEVQRVGDFDATFVPSGDDWDRVDRRFHLPEGVVDAKPEYANWGFAVFQLHGITKAGEDAPTRRYHPMGVLFARRDPSKLFFPTVHVHDGTVAEKARFDHTLFCQPTPQERKRLPLDQTAGHGRLSWREATMDADWSIDIPRSKGVVRVDRPILRTQIVGWAENRDTWA